MPLSETRRIQRRAKQAERDVGHWLLENDGPDPVWVLVASSAGRTGHINNLQMDAVSIHYAAEVKNIKMSSKLLSFWQQIQDVAAGYGKDALLVIKPSNPLARRQGVPKRSTDWHVITQERHAELLEAERQVSILKKALETKGGHLSLPSALEAVSVDSRAIGDDSVRGDTGGQQAGE